jgi:hypothetical protein
VLDEHFGREGNGKSGVFGYIEALGVGVDDFLDAGNCVERLAVVEGGRNGEMAGSSREIVDIEGRKV